MAQPNNPLVKDTTPLLPPPTPGPTDPSLSKQYGGIHSGTWVSRLPASWTPFIQLCRLSPPIGLILIYLPHLFGLLHAAATLHLPPTHTLTTAALLLCGSFFFSNSSHTWNDLVDAPIDAQITRTKTRPIPRGAVTPRAALAFTAVQAVLAAACLVPLPRDTALAVIPTVVATTYYPYAKRHTNLPQVVLGFCLAWGVVVAEAAAGVPQPWRDEGTLAMVVAVGAWVVIFDTIYAHQDLEDDLRVGVGSVAVLVRGWAKPALWGLYVVMSAAWVAAGWFGGMGVGYYAVTVGGCMVSVGAMVALVDLKDGKSCWKWFSTGFFSVGAACIFGLGVEYAVGLSGRE
ncbi:UbiA prenyltransferase family-domain-containing protein [Podospora conica]|nr:UbiA prenyltransferase family-domain-containing protein [Schizothecium conicum]